MTLAEMQKYNSYQGKGAARLTKRKREPSADADDQRPTKKHAGDVGVVVNHCTFSSQLDIVH